VSGSADLHLDVDLDLDFDGLAGGSTSSRLLDGVSRDPDFVCQVLLKVAEPSLGAHSVA
jgi:hypothetical protein